MVTSFNVTPPPKTDAKYPKSIFFIVLNEFCERFTYYGLRTVLTLYLTQRLYYSESTSTALYHSFAMMAYFTPLLGAMIADSWLGKFRTILYLSILYAIGCVILSVGAIPEALNTMKAVSLVGLVVIALGTGGIKPCVSAFGGDQFKEGQEQQLQQFFSIFYFSINLGSVISTFITPILREDVQCFGERTCFSVAFGVPAILMVIALFLFICGKPLYTIRPPSGNIVLKVSQCICYALKKKHKSSEKKKTHWLDYADDKFEKTLIEDIKILFHVLVLYIPLPVFWALFDQMGSRWTLQATRMDGKVNGYHIKADQMQVINPFLILAFIPFFDYAVYPCLSKFRLLRKPLQRITTGGMLAALSFIIAAFIELSLEKDYPVLPSPDYSQLTIVNNVPCAVSINGIKTEIIPPFETRVLHELPLDEQNLWRFNSENCSIPAEPYELSFNSSSSIESMMITLNNGRLIALKSEDTKTKAKTGEPKVRFFYNIEKPEDENITFILKGLEIDAEYTVNTTESFGMTEYIEVIPEKYKIFLATNETEIFQEAFRSGGIIIVHVYDKPSENIKNVTSYHMVKGNYVSILLQIPQYVIITAGEIMFSITGLEFSYSQAPNSMKSVIQAAWLLTVAVGNLIVLIIAEARLFEKQSHELFLFATLMGVDMVVFAILAYFYKYVKIKTPSEEELEEKSPSKRKSSESNGRSNDAYDEETDFNK